MAAEADRARGRRASLGVERRASCQKTAARAQTAGLTGRRSRRSTRRRSRSGCTGARRRRATSGRGRTRCTCTASCGGAGVTLELLHLEYLEQHPDGLRYTAFCDTYREWLSTARRRRCARCTRPARRCFVDYSGKKPSYVDPQTGEVIEVELFVAVLGASNYTYAEATRDAAGRRLHRARTCARFAYFGGVTEIDRARPAQERRDDGVPVRARRSSARTRSWRGTTARRSCRRARTSRATRRRSRSACRSRSGGSSRGCATRPSSRSARSTRASRSCCEDLNARPMKKLGGASRRELFERLDRPALRAAAGRAVRAWPSGRRRRVNLDYHVELDKHFYSAPYALVHERAVGARDGDDGRALPPRQARRVARAKPRAVQAHDRPGAHAGGAPRSTPLASTACSRGRASVGPMTRGDGAPAHRREPGAASRAGARRAACSASARSTAPSAPSPRARARCTLGARSYKPVANILTLGRERMPLPGEEPTDAPRHRRTRTCAGLATTTERRRRPRC